MPYMKIHLSNFVRNKQLHAPDFKASIRTNESVTNSQVENISLHGIASNNVQRADRCESNEEMNKASENDGKDESSRRKLLKLLEVAESQVYSAHSRKQNGKADGAVTNTSPKVEGTVTSVVSDNGKESREKILLTLNGSKAIRQAVTKKNVNSKKKTFAEKLMDILFTKDTEDVITWFPEGESFVVLSPSQFTRDVLPRFFKEAKYESFVRKLYRWGFKRIPGSAKDTAFYHNMFLRNQPELCKRMRSCNVIFGENEVKNRVASITTRQITVPASCEDPSQASVPMTQANLGKQTVRIDSALRSRGLPEAFNKVPSLQHNNSLGCHSRRMQNVSSSSNQIFPFINVEKQVILGDIFVGGGSLAFKNLSTGQVNGNNLSDYLSRTLHELEHRHSQFSPTPRVRKNYVTRNGILYY